MAYCKEVNVWQTGKSTAAPCDTPCPPPVSSTERFVATQGQVEFILTEFEYIPNSESFSVHRNGLLVDPVNILQKSETVFWIITETVNEGDIVIAESVAGLNTYLDVSQINTASYSTVLVSGQQLVTIPSETPIDKATFYLSSPDADNSRLVQNVHYSENFLDNSITLAESYPEGTTLYLIYGVTYPSEVGATGSFTTVDSKLVTVSNGLITDIDSI